MTAVATTHPTEAMTADEALSRLRTLDLSMVRLKLADPEEGKGWDEPMLDLAECEYRRFLALHLMYPEMAVVPCGTVDAVWHAHIVDTMAYGPDCEQVFGFFLHHFPYFGMRGDDDAADLADAYELTLSRYAAAFGDAPDELWRPELGAKCGRTNCKPQKCK